MGIRPTELKLRLAPQRRFEAIDVNTPHRRGGGRRAAAVTGARSTARSTPPPAISIRACRRACATSQDRLSQFFRAFHALFPQGGEYRHDQMELRTELTDEQKVVEPRNGDSHLTFIGAGMRNCVTYRTRPDAPVYFIDLDGMSDAHAARSARPPWSPTTRNG